jgi:hypothetical protein
MIRKMEKAQKRMRARTARLCPEKAKDQITNAKTPEYVYSNAKTGTVRHV